MSQYTNGTGDAVDQILCDMRQHVSGLQDKLAVAATAVTKSQTVNEKIAIMSQYQDKVSTLNSCWRSKNRSNLVANLQHENRQMIALEEENRQLRFALKEMEDGLHLIMSDYRRVFSGFIRSDLLFDFVKMRNKVNVNGCMEFDKFMEMAKRAEKCVVAADRKIADYEETIAQLKYENDGLRELLHNNQTFKKRESDQCFASQRKNSVIMVKGVSLPAALEEKEALQSGRVDKEKDPLQPPPSSNQYKTVNNININMIRGQSMPGCSSSKSNIDNTNGISSSMSAGIRWPVHNTRPKRAAIIKKLVQEQVETFREVVPRKSFPDLTTTEPIPELTAPSIGSEKVEEPIPRLSNPNGIVDVGTEIEKKEPDLVDSISVPEQNRVINPAHLKTKPK